MVIRSQRSARWSRRTVLTTLGAALLALAACSSGDEGGARPTNPEPTNPQESPPDGGANPGTQENVQDGDETDVDCGGSSSTRCADGQKCNVGGDCASGVCTDGACAAPSPTDGVKNGDETDVDCGGTTGIKCGVGKACKVHADCTMDACREGVCAAGKSCRAVAGGATCGPGEVGSPEAKHEDCCIVLEVPRPEAQGGPYKLDKYLITAGRMRAFLEDVKNDVKAFVTANPPPGWTNEWTASVPSNEAEVVMQLGVGQRGATSYGSQLGPGCYVKGQGAPAFWLTPEQQAANGDIPRELTQAQLDTKVLNCATRALFAAFCHWDGGGRLPTMEEWKYAVNGGDESRKYPWGSDTPIGNFASYNFNYVWPVPPDGYVDRGWFLPAPGRFPQGQGPFGHMDLAGAVETFLASGGVMQYSFQEAGLEQYRIQYGRSRSWNPSTKHWAIGARCARSM
jgi:formylglycine-generating enzyme required for sulfatase activity